MGIVKNRCKNGDYYWVDAYITPMLTRGVIIGYESTRVKASAEDVRRAENLYKQINAGNKNALGRYALGFSARIYAAILLVMLCAGGALAISGVSVGLVISTFAVAAGVGCGLVYWVMAPYRKLMVEIRDVVDSPVIQSLYTDCRIDIASISVAVKMLKAKVRTIVKRMETAVTRLANEAQVTATVVSETTHGINRQKSETEQVATAVNEMTASIQEVASNAANAAQASQTANDAAHEGALTSTKAIGIIDSLASELGVAVSVITDLEGDSEKIGGVLDVIKSIAEQTNLLALNAAIEAARAGEQGRGFAVVADEVRTLAHRTHASTEEIQSMIEQLQNGSKRAVQAMGSVSKCAEESVAHVENTAEALAAILGTIGTIGDMNTQIATASEEQTAVVEEINRNVTNINAVTQQSAERAGESDTASHNLMELASRLDVMMEHFGGMR
ncbi:MAG: methyl-accepting chemotaxis protein [Gammaproteobacteria bacterium]|nr:methyl-accepting chemotaxis protein [Gammaproteobacteria bacterium]